MSYSYSYDSGLETVFGFLFTGAMLVVSILVACAAIIALWRIFSKAGEAGWASIIPFYNAYVLYKITWGNGWFFLLNLIPIVNVVISILTCIKLAQSFERSGAFAVGLIFLNTIFMLILGFDRSRYIGPGGVPQQKNL